MPLVVSYMMGADGGEGGLLTTEYTNNVAYNLYLLLGKGFK